MAMGGRVNFQDGDPDPFIEQAISALGNPKVAEQFIKDNTPSTMDEIYGEDGERNLLQTFNTMFADPRSYPYYASRIVEGGSRIPEYAVRTVPALASLASESVFNLIDNRYPEGKLERFIDRISPKVTDAIQDKIGLTSLVEQQEKDISGPQKMMGDLSMLAAEIPGPATPVGFLYKIYPKLQKGLASLGVTGSAADKVNKEIENRINTLGVDQGRRDLILATGAGGAVALLKYLGLDKLIGTGTKVAQKAAPEIITKGGTPKYFFDFVNLIKSKGKDVSETASTVERQKVYDYNGYTMTEDISTGKISINKDTEGGASYYIGDGEYDTVDGIIRKEEIVYDPPETILDDAGKPKKVPDIYEENTLTPDYDGSDGDIQGGLDSIDEILELLAESGEKYNLKELTEMGMNPEGLGPDLLKRILRNPDEIKLLDAKKSFKDTMNKVKYKIEKAEGGIISGVKSGPPPKSGPTPHGLPYVAKNVRPIKERK